jgi:antitoxin component YwqK of YwqJK toxin-antitoxin module
MKLQSQISLLALTILLAACQSSSPPCFDEPVCEKYMHRYGVQLEHDDWVSRGQNGQVISRLKNGMEVSRNYDNGVLEGETIYTFPNSHTIAKTETYSEGILTQEVENYSAGLPFKKTIYQTNHDKTVLAWYESSAPQSKEIYEGGLLIEGEYYLPSGQLEAKIRDQQGVRMQRDQFGQLVSKEIIANGKVVSQTELYPSGSPKAVKAISHGIVHGQVFTFLPGGEPNTIEEWTHGIQHGQTVVFQNGEKYAEVPYNKGIRNGIERRFTDDHVVVEEITWKNGVKDGPARTYVDGGVKTRWYFQDREVTQSGYEVLSSPIP